MFVNQAGAELALYLRNALPYDEASYGEGDDRAAASFILLILCPEEPLIPTKA